MAKYQAIAATGQAILGLLADSCPRPEFESARFELYQLKDFQSPIEEGLTLYLYRIAVNGSRRNLPPTTGPDGRRYRPALPLDFHYLLTAWAKTAARQQRLLGWAVRALQDVPVLPASFLGNYAPEPDVFRPGESVEVILDPLSLPDLNNLWSAAKVSPPLSVSYLARMILIESEIPLEDAEPVQTRGREGEP
jgi:Pvc16 N-terminal domain